MSRFFHPQLSQPIGSREANAITPPLSNQDLRPQERSPIRGVVLCSACANRLADVVSDETEEPDLDQLADSDARQLRAREARSLRAHLRTLFRWLLSHARCYMVALHLVT